jgi:hypothetical protein
MKFRIRVGGKDSISNGVSDAPRAAMGLPDNFDPDADVSSIFRYEAAIKNLHAFVERWCENGDGGEDHVTLEFDTEAGTCVVVPVREAKKRGRS